MPDSLVAQMTILTGFSALLGQKRVLLDRGVVAGNVTDKYRIKNPLARRLMDGFLARVAQLYRDTDAQSVLEVGCGEGDLCAHLQAQRPADFVGLDISAKVLQLARDQHPTMPLSVQSAASLAFDSNSFDLVVICEVLEHLPDPRAALKEVARVARRDVILSVPREPVWRLLNVARGAYWRALGNTPGHLQHWGRQDFVRFVSSELSVVQVCSPLPWTVIAARVPR